MSPLELEIEEIIQMTSDITAMIFLMVVAVLFFSLFIRRS